MTQKKILISDYTLHYLYSNLTEYPGGAAVEWYHWIKGFNENNVRVGVLTLKGTRKYITKELNFDLIESWDISSGIPRLKMFYPLIPSFFKAIKKYNPDYLVLETSRRETIILALISKILSKKFIYRIASDYEVDERIKNYITKIYAFLFYFGLRLSDIIFCQNQYQEEMLKRKFPNKKIILLNTPFSLSVNNRVKEKRERSYIAWIGTFRSVKNIPALLEIVKKLPELKFKVAGGKIIKDFTDNDTENAVIELKKMKNVEFVDYMDYEEIPKFLEGAYTLLNTSKLEGFSNTFLESWAAGTPIVSTKNVNPNNIINKFNVGLITESYNDLPDALMKIVNLPEDEYHNLSQRCINYISEYHDAKTLASKFLSYLEN
jgi:glycosyltransferase involved in cell wall biosynthesis